MTSVNGTPRTVTDTLNVVSLLISRRGAGVWTNLPSLTFEFLRNVPGPASVLWLDFGLRYEMLNHFRIQPIHFPHKSTLPGLAGQVRMDGVIRADDIVAYDQLLASTGHTLLPSSKQTYDNIVLDLAKQQKRAYLIPVQLAQSGGGIAFPNLKVDELESAVGSILDSVKPTHTVFTCEGQPEAGLFSEKLADDKILQWCLDHCTKIVCMIRHDSEQRFQDGIAIPSVLSRNPVWRSRLRLLLTRATRSPRIPAQFLDMVIGHLPFAEFVGESVSNGRIPLIDLLAKGSQESLSDTEQEYVTCVSNVSHKLFQSAYEKVG